MDLFNIFDGYLPKDVKQIVDEIVDHMLSVKIVSDCYDRWLVLQGKVDNFYAGENEPRQRLPLSQVKEFRAIKNAVIKVADDIRLGRVTFEDETLRQDDEHGEVFITGWCLASGIAEELKDHRYSFEQENEESAREISLSESTT